MRILKLNRTRRYLLGVCVLLITLNAVLGFLLTRQSANAMRTQIQYRMLDIANTAAAMLDGDALKKISAEDEQTPEYQSVLKILTYFQENIELEYIYCVRDMGNRSFVFTIDPTVEDPGDFGEPVVYTDALYRASLGTPSVDTEPYEDEWGRFYSAYAPVFDSEHKIGGIVAVDFSASWYDDQIATLIWTTVVIIVAAMILSAAMAFMIASRYKKSFSRLFGEMNGLSDGIETLVNEVSPRIEDSSKNSGRSRRTDAGHNKDAVSMRGSDEIEILGDRIRVMQNRLREEVSYIRSKAFVDGLTGLGNRMAYEDHLKSLDDRIALGDAPEFAIAVFDINGLKIINDDFGHEEGDRVIFRASEAIKEAFAEDLVYRIGGDEFVVIIYEKDPEEGVERLRNVLDRINGEKKTHEIAISAGYAGFDEKLDKDFSSVFTRADLAMYADKKLYYETHEDRRKQR